MAVYYKFKSAKDYHSIPIDGPFISIINLKERIFNSKLLGRGKDFDLVVTNAQTNEEYLDEAMLIPKNISVLIRRVPGPPCKPIITQPHKPEVENQVEYDQPVKCNFKATNSSGFLDFEASEWDDEFGSSLYPTNSEMTLGQSKNLVLDSVPSNKSDEDNKIKALAEATGFMQQNHNSDGLGPGKRGGQGARSFGQGGFECKTLPQGYVCYRCKVAGHFIQHCPTNGDPDYDIKKVRPPTGVPKSMLVQLDGTYALPSGTATVLQPNEAAFEKEMERLPSTRILGDLPPELHCPICKEVMKDAVLTSKCCFGSFCDKCIRNNIISKSVCVCGAREILADDLVPNMTLRDTISHILESGSSSADNSGSGLQVQGIVSARCPQTRTSSPTQSAASKGNQMVDIGAKETPNSRENLDGGKHSDAPQQQVQTSGEGKISKVPCMSEAAQESATVKELDSPVPVQGKVQQKVAVVEAGKKKKKKKRISANAADMGWMGMQPSMDGYMGPSAFNRCWPGMQPAVNEFVSPFGSNISCSMGYGNMGYSLGPFGNIICSDPYGAHGFMMAATLPPLQRNLAGESGVNTNVRPQLLNEEGCEVGKAEVRRKQEMERRVERDLPQNRDYGREASGNAKAPSMNKLAPARRSPSVENYNHYRDHDHDCRNEQKRSSLNHYRKSEHTSYDRGHDQDRFSHHRATSRDSNVLCPTLKRKSQHYQLDHEKDHDGSQSKSFSKPSEAFQASSGKNQRERMLVRISFEDRCKKRKQECF